MATEKTLTDKLQDLAGAWRLQAVEGQAALSAKNAAEEAYKAASKKLRDLTEEIRDVLHNLSQSDSPVDYPLVVTFPDDGAQVLIRFGDETERHPLVQRKMDLENRFAHFPSLFSCAGDLVFAFGCAWFSGGLKAADSIFDALPGLSFAPSSSFS